MVTELREGYIAKNHTFSSLLESMLSDIITEDNRAPKTSSTYRYDLMYLLPPEFFKRPINSITEAALKSIIVTQTKQISIKPTRLRKCIQAINRVFNYGIRNHICLNNPALNIDPNRYLSNCDATVKTAEEKEFSMDILKRVVVHRVFEIQCIEVLELISLLFEHHRRPAIFICDSTNIFIGTALKAANSTIDAEK